jgi:hypothetical protein
MFTRPSSAEPKLEPRAANSSRTNGAQNRALGPESTEKSIIGNDLKIIGQGLKIIGRGVLRRSRATCRAPSAEVIVGEKGKVTGMVAAENVIIRGRVSGVVCGKAVALQSSSRVEGDVHHISLAIEQGALFEGRSRRATSESELHAVVEGRSAGQPASLLRPVAT